MYIVAQLFEYITSLLTRKLQVKFPATVKTLVQIKLADFSMGFNH
jgi:hypothetical protein